MENIQKIILITGANKGIGFGLAKGLLKQSNHKIILTSRDESRGKESLRLLEEEFPNKDIIYHQLDITDKDSINTCVEWVNTKFGKIDILVNNAGVAAKGNSFNTDVFDMTFATNVYGTIDFTEKMIDRVKDNGKIIIIGSTSGMLNKLKSEEIKEEIRKSDSIEKLYELASRFRKAIENEAIDKEGWCYNTYSVSKMLINTYARILGKKKEILDRNIQVYACCPGWVRTDMAGPNALLSVEEGIITPMYLIELEDKIKDEIQGKFFYECKLKEFDH